MSVIVEVDHVSKYFTHLRYDEARVSQKETANRWCLRDINFSFKSGCCYGIVGSNGSGKSTLLKIIAGVYAPSGGTVRRHGDVCSILELGFSFQPLMSGLDNIKHLLTLRRLDQKQIASLIPLIVEFADIGDAITRPIRTYSTGMRMRIGFAAAIFPSPSILIIDEAIAVGDIEFQRRCFDKLRDLKAKNTAILFVSHDIETVINLADQAILIEDGYLQSTGDPVKVIDRYIFGPPNQALSSFVASTNRSASGQNETSAVGWIEEEIIRLMTTGTNVYPSNFLNPEEAANENGPDVFLGAVVLVDGEVLNNGHAVRAGAVIDVYIGSTGEFSDHLIKLGFSLRNEKGNYVYGINSDLRGDFIQSWRRGETHFWRFSIKLAVGDGRYFLSLGCYKSDFWSNERLAVRQNWLVFDVAGERRFKGIVDLLPD